MASRFAIVAALLSAATQAQEPAAAPIIYTRDSWHVVENGSITDILSYSPAINATRDDNSPVALHINTRDTGKRNQTAPYLYGLMHEDISHSGDGGIYAEMLSNRAFQGSDWRVTNIEGFNGSFIFNAENPIEPIGPVITAWESVGDNVRLNLDRLHPISDALQNGIQLDIPFNATGEVGVCNTGWWGMDVSPQTYKTFFHALGNRPRNWDDLTDFTFSLRSNETGEVYASSTLRDQDVPEIDFARYETTLQPNRSAPNSNNTFCVTMDGEQVAGHTYYFTLFSLFPETFRGTENGLRRDIAEAFYGLNPTFLRFPGGNNLGKSPQARWKWNETLGPLIDRPGRPGDWQYYNTQGLGLHEYLMWCEDMEIEPLLDVYSGFSLDIYDQNGPSYSEDRMGEIVQEALDELEYCMGDPNETYWGSVRAANGHPEPFPVHFVEIGNEDWFSETYPYRWPIMYEGLKARYPDITYIASAYNENPNWRIDLPEGTLWDTHHYEEPSYFVRNFDYYDNWQERENLTDVGIFVGEYSVLQIDTPEGNVVFNQPYPENLHVNYPRLFSALAEGVYALGLERNPNVAKFGAYAPSLQNLNYFNWVPNMIAYDADPANTILSASYYQQQLFASYRGTQVLPVTNSEGDFNPMFWVATIDEPSNSVYLKVINTLNSSVPLSVDFDCSWHNVNGTIITASDLNAYNFINNQTEVVPAPIEIDQDAVRGEAGVFQWEVPRWSINVLQFQL
ncbi:hypothetical protein MBLNU230_g4734t1 [Neophaeotheca triangularis]